MAENDLFWKKNDLNELPDLSMADITEQLFNNKFMSDVEFHIDGKLLFAHSWELMKRSVVFRSQMRDTMGENKLVPIEDTCYDVFYQFIRFIYTDQCDINEHNEMELLKMARKYKVIPLETKVINESQATLKLFQYCVLEKYGLAYHRTREKLSKDLILFKDQLSTVHPDVLEEILKLDYLDNLKEHELFELLMVWINKACETNQISLTQRRSHFDKFFRLIRFSAMTLKEFSICVQKHMDLFTNDDIPTIFKEISAGPDSQNTKMNSKSRLPFNSMYRRVQIIFFSIVWHAEVSTPIILSAVRIGTMKFEKCFGITVKISAIDPATQKISSKTYSFPNRSNEDISKLLNFGESIVLKPDIEYAIQITSDRQYYVESFRRCSNDVILSGPPDIIQILGKANILLHEIIYKLETK